MTKKKLNIIIIIITILLCAFINVILEELIIKFIINICASILVVICVSKINEYSLDIVDKAVSVIYKVVKILSIFMCVTILLINVLYIKDATEQYSEISNNNENTVILYSGVLTKKIVIECTKIYDGVQYIRYSIFNEEDEIHDIKSKYISINNEIIDTIDSISNVRIKDTIPLLFKSRKVFKNIKKLIKLYWLSILSISIIFYLVIRKCIIFNKKRKNS